MRLLLGLEAADDGFSGVVEHAAAGEGRVWDEVAILGSDADGEDVDAGLGGLGDEVIGVAVVFFAVAEDDEGVVFLAGFAEGFDGEGDGGAEV